MEVWLSLEVEREVRVLCIAFCFRWLECVDVCWTSAVNAHHHRAPSLSSVSGISGEQRETRELAHNQPCQKVTRQPLIIAAIPRKEDGVGGQEAFTVEKGKAMTRCPEACREWGQDAPKQGKQRT